MALDIEAELGPAWQVFTKRSSARMAKDGCVLDVLPAMKSYDRLLADVTACWHRVASFTCHEGDASVIYQIMRHDTCLD